MQVEATNNFEVSRPISILCGGLDQQIEHHLFPRLPPNRLRADRPRGARRLRGARRALSHRRAGAPTLKKRAQADRAPRPLRRGAPSLREAGVMLASRARDAGRCRSHGRRPDEYTIDELATRRRACPAAPSASISRRARCRAPQIRGRVAYYGPAHVERLKLIGSLQDRGLRIRAIRDLLAQADKGELALNEWLGLEQQLQEPWAERSARASLDRGRAASELLGDRRPGAIAELLRAASSSSGSGDGYLVQQPGAAPGGAAARGGGHRLRDRRRRRRDPAQTSLARRRRSHRVLLQTHRRRLRPRRHRRRSGDAYKALRPSARRRCAWCSAARWSARCASWSTRAPPPRCRPRRASASAADGAVARGAVLDRSAFSSAVLVGGLGRGPVFADCTGGCSPLAPIAARREPPPARRRREGCAIDRRAASLRFLSDLVVDRRRGFGATLL